MAVSRLSLIGAAAGCLLLAGCAGTSEFVPISQDTYTVTGHSEFTDYGGQVRIDLIKKAQAFCSQKGGEFQLLNSAYTDGGTYKAATSSTDFACVSQKAK